MKHVNVNVDFVNVDASICNNKQRWNDNKSRCECKQVIKKGVCHK